MSRCLYCLQSDETVTFHSEEHVIPQSMGNREIILKPGVVCDKCNNGILSQLDQALLDFDPISFMRVYNRIPSKKGKLPIVRYPDLVMEATNLGHVDIKPHHKRVISLSQNGFVVQGKGRKKYTTAYIRDLCRSLYKITLGLIYIDHGAEFAYSGRFDPVREMILGETDFHGYIAVKNSATPSAQVTVQYNFASTPGKPDTTWVMANFYGVIMFTDLERRTVAHPELMGDTVTVLYF